jgi:hypothetical protein
MFLFPFQRFFLAATKSRQEILNSLLELTYLSDENFKSDGKPKFFFGETDIESFALQTISADNRLTDYAEGRLKGVDHEMYVFLTLKGFKHRRIYLVLLTFLAICLWLLGTDLYDNGLAAFNNPPFYLLAALVLGLTIFMVNKYIRFVRVKKNALLFFSGLFEATVIKKSQIPLVFRN